MSKPDYQLFILWHNALESSEQIVKMIAKSFEIIHLDKLYWKPNDKFRYLGRLYSKIKSSKTSSKITNGDKDNPFVIMIVKDSSPIYALRHNINGNIPRVNKNITQTKEDIRKMVGGNFVHSTDNPKEFIMQSALILGTSKLESILLNSNPDNTIFKSMHKTEFKANQLIGHKGFQDWDKLFNLLNLTIEYVLIQSQRETKTSTLRVLTRDKADFLSIVGAKRWKKGFYIIINGENIHLFIEELNDMSIDPLFQHKILENRVKINDTYYISNELYAFRLLYDYLLYKNSNIDHNYLMNRLDSSGPINFDKQKFDEAINYRIHLLQGYFKENNFLIYCNNKSKIKTLKKFSSEIIVCNKLRYKLIKHKIRFLEIFKRVIQKFTPKIVKILIPKKLKAYIVKK